MQMARFSPKLRKPSAPFAQPRLSLWSLPTASLRKSSSQPSIWLDCDLSPQAQSPAFDFPVQKKGEVAASPSSREEVLGTSREASLPNFPETARGHTITAAAEISFIKLPPGGRDQAADDAEEHQWPSQLPAPALPALASIVKQLARRCFRGSQQVLQAPRQFPLLSHRLRTCHN